MSNLNQLMGNLKKVLEDKTPDVLAGLGAYRRFTKVTDALGFDNVKDLIMGHPELADEFVAVIRRVVK